jgi:hypothetical protein
MISSTNRSNAWAAATTRNSKRQTPINFPGSDSELLSVESTPCLSLALYLE